MKLSEKGRRKTILEKSTLVAEENIFKQRSQKVKIILSADLNVLRSFQMKIERTFVLLTGISKIMPGRKDSSQLNVTETSRERSKGQERKKNRELSIEYSFQKTNVSERVCKTFFMKTLCISWGPIHKALEGRDISGAFVESDKRGKSESANKTDKNIRKQIKEHIESFPSVQSHCTRKDSRRRYLAQSLTITKIVPFVQGKMQSQNLNAASEKICRRIFCDEYNLAFFKPKKDQCATCCKNEVLRGQEKEAFQNEYQ